MKPSIIQRLRTQAARQVRRGSRTVLLTPDPGPRFGNFLYYWLHAHVQSQRGRDYRVQVHPHLRPWLQVLPDIKDQLSVTSSAVRRFDRREWPPAEQFQVASRDFTSTDLEAFIRTYLLWSPLLQPPSTSPTPTIINVRRGDFYSNPHFRKMYGFNIGRYVETALGRLPNAALKQVAVVSDDARWCREHIEPILNGRCHVREYVGHDRPSQQHFRLLSEATWLIGANSTFSYWGAYVASIRSAGTAHVVMPRFRTAAAPDGGAYQLLPHWDIVETIPGGWQ